MLDMKGRSILTLDDLSDAEFMGLLDLAAELKAVRATGEQGRHLARKQVAMLFEKSSTRTRCAISVAAFEEGGRAEYLSSREIHLGKKESVADTARVLGRMFQGIVYRGFAQKTVETLAQYAGVPVLNGLTDESHPTQTLADLMTVKEYFGTLAGLKLVYLGDGRNNVANSLMLGCAKTGMHFVNCTPPELQPEPARVDAAEQVAQKHGGTIQVESDVTKAVEGAHVIYTDVWVSMGEEDKREERLALLRPYQVNMDVMRATGNLESGRVIFLHCLPAFHNDQTDASSDSGALEVTDDVFESDFSRVFDEAENRMHTIKAIFVATM